MKIRKCPNCKTYTLKEVCPKCSSQTRTAHPPKFSIEKEQKYGKYRRAEKITVK